MPTFVLTDVANDLWFESFTTGPDALGLMAEPRWSIVKRRLRGGRRDGVDLIEVDNGRFSFAIIPTRGMGIWKGVYQGHRIGWESPVSDGPVNPSFVNLMNLGGLGWLDGFDELLVRCGLSWNGAPYEVKAKKSDGSESNTTFGLHGKIANLPASYVAVHVDEKPPHEIVVEGHVEETHLFGPQIRMVTRIATVPGSNRIRVRDEFHNLKDQPADLEILYHWNFGPPFLEEGSSFVAPFKVVTPRDPRAVEGLSQHDRYSGPEPGSTEQVYFYELQGRSSESGKGETLAMLRNRAGEKAVVLRFCTSELPCFTLWKNTAGRRDGYVTGLEPATNYPNPKPFEKARNRVLTLPVDGRYVAETLLEVLTTSKAIAAAEREIEELKSQAPVTVHPGPKEPYATEG